MVFVFHFNNLNWEINTWMIMIVQQIEISIFRDSFSFAIKATGAVATPENCFHLSTRDHIFVTVMQQNFATFRRLCEYEAVLS